MGLESGNYISDFDTANPVGAVDKRHQGDDHLRLIKTFLKNTFPNASKPFRFPSILSKSANYTVLSSDANATIFVDTTSAQIDITLPTLAAGDAGWGVRVVKSTTDVNAVRVVGTINGESNMLVNNRYEVLDLIWSGSAWLGIADLNGYRVAIITGDLTATEDHLDGIILSTPTGANKTITLPAVASYRGRMLSVHHTGNTYSTTLDGNGAETINGAATLVLSATNQSVVLVAMATGWVVLAQGGGATATAAEAIAATDASKFVTPSALKPFGRQGANIASAGTITVTDDGDYFHVTGTTTITDIDMTTDATGREFTLVFDGVLTLTHNATTLILPGGTNIITAAGDAFTFRSEGSDVVRCIGYAKADGKPIVNPSKWVFLEDCTQSVLGVRLATTVSLAGYTMFRITIIQAAVTGNNSLSLEYSVNNGGAYSTLSRQTSSMVDGGGGTTTIGTANLSGGVVPTTVPGLSGDILISHPTATLFNLTSRLFWDAGTGVLVQGGGQGTPASAVTNFALARQGGGNIAVGTRFIIEGAV